MADLQALNASRCDLSFFFFGRGGDADLNIAFYIAILKCNLCVYVCVRACVCVLAPCVLASQCLCAHICLEVDDCYPVLEMFNTFSLKQSHFGNVTI